MKIKQINKILEHFEKYSNGRGRNYGEELNIDIEGFYFHKEENFSIEINEDLKVFQLNTDHENVGIELVDLNDFMNRFKSFTGVHIGEYLNNVDDDNPEESMSLI